MARIPTQTSPSFFVFACCLFLLFSPPILFAAELQIESDTLLRVFESDITANEDERVAPVYQYLKLNADNFSIEGLSFHAYGWGRQELLDSDFFSEQSGGELIYAYLDYTATDAPFSARLGRQYIFSGVANDSIDGLWLKGALSEYLSASVYAGQPVGLSSTAGRSGDSIYGGRLAHKNKNFYEIGLSYQTSQNDGDTAANLLGIDLSAGLPMNASLYGYSTRNLETEGWAEHSYEVNFQLDNFSFRPFYEYYSYLDYFDSGANATNPFNLLALSGEELSTIGIDASWRQSESFTFGGKFKAYSYDQNQASNLISLLVSWNSDSVELTQAGAEIGYMSGDAANNDYLLLRLYGFIDELSDRCWLDFISGDVVYALYDRDILGRDYSLFTSLGTGKTFFNDQLTLRLSGDYSQDPYFDDNLQVLLSASFAYDFSL